MTSIFGPYDYPLGGPVGWVLFLLFFAVIAIGYAVGIGYSHRAKVKPPESSYRLYRFYKWTSLLSAFGGALLQLEFLVTGRSIAYSMRNVSEIRAQGFIESSTLLTTVGFPLTCTIFSIIFVLIKLLGSHFRINRVFICLNAFTIFSLLSVSLIGTNRQLFLALFLLLIVSFSLLSNKLCFRVFVRIPIYAKMIGTVLFVLFIAYFLFIARYRGTEQYAIHSFRKAPLKYEIPYLSELSPGMEAACYSIIFYPSHTVPHATKFFDVYDRLFDFKPMVANWYITQAARFLPIYRLPVSHYANQKRYEADIAFSQWPTMFFTVAGSFGLLGGYTFMLAWGISWGYAVATWCNTRRLLPFIFSCWLTFGLIFGFMYFPNETYYHSNLLFLAFIALFRRHII